MLVVVCFCIVDSYMLLSFILCRRRPPFCFVVVHVLHRRDCCGYCLCVCVLDCCVVAIVVVADRFVRSVVLQPAGVVATSRTTMKDRQSCRVKRLNLEKRFGSKRINNYFSKIKTRRH